MKLRFVLLATLLVSCTNINLDKSTNYFPASIRTQIDFQPPHREERLRRIGQEQALFNRDTAPFRQEIERLTEERTNLFREVEKEFPQCRKQKHCLSQMVRQDVKRFERYNEVTVGLRNYDRQLIEQEAKLALLEYRKNMRVRALYNRYLVYEFLQLQKQSRQILNMRAHSLEAFQDRKSLSYRILRLLKDETYFPAVVGELDFQTWGKPIDEASVLATFDIVVRDSQDPSDLPSRYLVTFLINSHQLDTQAYESHFHKAWVKLITEKEQKTLRGQVLCGGYSIASPFLAARLDPRTSRPCTERRALMQTKSFFNYEKSNPEHWMIPVAYFKYGKPN